MRAAYDALPDATKNRIKGMKTAYMMTSSVRADVTNIDVLKDQAAVQKGSMIQPLVQTHPERSTKSIWFHAGKTENILGMESTGTRSLLAELPEEAIKPELSYVHEYIVGDMLTVDNRSAMHKAAFDCDHSQYRLLYCALVRGTRLV